MQDNNIKINFIVGSGRSGTTLLHHIFNNHKNCISSSERKHLLFFYKKYHDIKEVTPNLLKEVSEYHEIMKQALPVNYPNLVLNFKLGEKVNYLNFCKRLYFQGNTVKKNTHLINTIIDKNPFYTLQVDKLHAILPEAKFLCVVRDYRGFVLSNIQSQEPYSKNSSIPNHSIIWLFYNKLVLNIERKYQNQTKIILYEDFVKNKEGVFKEVCDFFNLEFDLNCFNYQENISNGKIETLNFERSVQKKITLLKPINADRLDAWKEFFTVFQLKIMDFWCGKIGKEFGYKATTKANFIESIFIFMISFPYYIKCLIYFNLKSIKLQFYLSEKRKAKFINKLIKKNA